MPLTLHFSRNPNPRLAVATARYLNAPVRYAFAEPLAPGNTERFTPLNPNLRLPILEEDGQGLWEADAVALRLARETGSDFWPSDMRAEADLMRWISWGHGNFVRGSDMVHFERGTKQRYTLGPIDPQAIEDGLALFHASARILEQHLEARDFLLGPAPSYADFRMATFLPFNKYAQLPLGDYAAVSRWHERLQTIPAWADPFNGLDAPPLPPVPGID